MSARLPVVGLRTRLFLVSVLLIGLVGTTSALLLRSSLHELLEARLRAELQTQALAVRAVLVGLDPPPTAEAVGPLLPGLGEARVQVFDEQGRLLADSWGPEAAERSRGPTLDARVEAAGGRFRGEVRVGVEEARLAAVLAPFDMALVAAGLVGIGVAIFMSGLASHLASRDLRAMLGRVQGALGRAGGPTSMDESADLSLLAGGVHDLALRWERASASAMEERARLGALLHSMSEGVLALDPDGRVTEANPAAHRLLNPREELVGRGLAESVRASGLIEVARAAMHEHRAAQAEVELEAQRTVLATARPLQGAPGAVLVLHDLSEQRRLERVRRDFVANVSHELRTPVSIIRSNAENLADGALEDPKVARIFVEAILRNTERLGDLIRDLLDLSRIEAGHQEVRSEPTGLRRVAERALDNLRPVAQARGTRMDNLVPADLRALCDPQALEQILTNLVENAVRYGEAEGRVWLRGEGRAEGVRLWVEDDGPGIPQHHRDRIFERFYRVDPGRARQQGGTGLGLAIVKNLAEAMGGRVGVLPNEPRGSRFWVELRRAPEA